MAKFELPDEMRDDMRAAWYRYLANTLCVPTRKGIVPEPPEPSSLGIDHFRCYKAQPMKGSLVPEVEVFLEDQFESRLARTKKCYRFCNPVDKDGGGIMNPKAHLTCYRLKDLSSDPPIPLIDLNTENQFGEMKLTARTRSTRLLCVPSLKEDLP